MWKSNSDIPNEVKRRFESALALRDAGHKDQSCLILASLIDQYPDWSPPYSIKGGILFDLNRLKEAEECFRHAVRLKPQSEIASLCLFHALWAQSERESAMDEMKRFTVAGGISSDYQAISNELLSKAE